MLAEPFSQNPKVQQVPSTQVWQLKTACVSNSSGYEALPWPLQSLALTCAHSGTHNVIKNKINLHPKISEEGDAKSWIPCRVPPNMRSGEWVYLGSAETSQRLRSAQLLFLSSVPSTHSQEHTNTVSVLGEYTALCWPPYALHRFTHSIFKNKF